MNRGRAPPAGVWGTLRVSASTTAIPPPQPVRTGATAATAQTG
jgi:hypothetical protein